MDDDKHTHTQFILSKKSQTNKTNAENKTRKRERLTHNMNEPVKKNLLKKIVNVSNVFYYILLSFVIWFHCFPFGQQKKDVKKNTIILDYRYDASTCLAIVLKVEMPFLAISKCNKTNACHLVLLSHIQTDIDWCHFFFLTIIVSFVFPFLFVYHRKCNVINKTITMRMRQKKNK